MSRLYFDFRVIVYETRSFDPEEFRGLDPLDIVEALRKELPPNVDQIELFEAAEALHAELEFGNVAERQ